MTVSIRPARTEDAEVIADFNARLAADTEDLVLDRARLLAGVRAVLADPAKGFYAMAERAGATVGQLLVTREWSDWRNGDFWWIQSVFVVPEARGAGVFRSLYEHVDRLARERGDVCGLRLYVERHNERAQRTYARLGMQRTVYDMFETDYVLRR